MKSPDYNSCNHTYSVVKPDKLRGEANSRGPSRELEQMARRRYQKPEPVVRGRWWTLLIWEDVFIGSTPRENENECGSLRLRCRNEKFSRCETSSSDRGIKDSTDWLGN